MHFCESLLKQKEGIDREADVLEGNKGCQGWSFNFSVQAAGTFRPCCCWQRRLMALRDTKLFRKFHQVSAGTSRSVYPGHGVAIVRGL